jgi:hypothetical protein
MVDFWYTVKAMGKEIIFLVEEYAEAGYTAKALGYSIFTEADSLDELKTNIQDAVSCHLGNTKKSPIIRLRFNKHL